MLCGFSITWRCWSFRRGKTREPGETESLIEQAVSQLQLTTNSTDIWHRAGIESRPQHPAGFRLCFRLSRSVETITTSGRGTSGISRELTPHLLSQTPLAAQLFLRSSHRSRACMEQARITMVGGERSHHWAIPAGEHES